MYLSSVTLHNWKVYIHAEFNFPKPTLGKNIVLIGAQNGHGKTSLFEAIVLGLFGRDGLPQIARNPFTRNGDARLETNYTDFLERALYQGAINNSDNSCSIKLIFFDDQDESIEIQRIWHFTDRGKYNLNDEEVRIYKGSARKPIEPTQINTRGKEQRDWYRDYISQEFLPYSLATFFLFDGEQVRDLAEREKSVQVRRGIEGLLGIPILKDLAADLRKYAKARRPSTKTVPGEEEINRLVTEREKIEGKLKECSNKLDKIDPELYTLKDKREKLTKEITGYGVGTQAQHQEKVEQLASYRKAVEQAQEKLQEMLRKDISLAIAGRDLRTTLVSRLKGEDALAKWENSKNQGDANLDRFLNKMTTRINKIVPELNQCQKEEIREHIIGSWKSLWYPPPENCTDGYRHSYLNESDRNLAISKLLELDKLESLEILNTVKVLLSAEVDAKRLDREIRSATNIVPLVQKKADELTHINNKIQSLDRESGSLNREIAALKAQEHAKNQEIARSSAKLDQEQPNIRRATRAEVIAGVVDQIVSKAVPDQTGEIAQKMTDAYQAMAHKKGMIKKIEITDECDVKILNSIGGDIQSADLSAGEKQIFTQALLAAVVSVSARAFPIIVDTPLGRLDIEHRKGILRDFAKRESQVILLSTDTEVVGDYLDSIKDNILKTYRIMYNSTGDAGYSTLHEGYFDNESGV